MQFCERNFRALLLKTVNAYLETIVRSSLKTKLDPGFYELLNMDLQHAYQKPGQEFTIQFPQSWRMYFILSLRDTQSKQLLQNGKREGIQL